MRFMTAALATLLIFNLANASPQRLPPPTTEDTLTTEVEVLEARVAKLEADLAFMRSMFRMIESDTSLETVIMYILPQFHERQPAHAFIGYARSPAPGWNARVLYDRFDLEVLSVRTCDYKPLLAAIKHYVDTALQTEHTPASHAKDVEVLQNSFQSWDACRRKQ